MKYQVGIDEVGRGPIAGPVTVCACIFLNSKAKTALRGIRDSKKLSPQKREEWFKKIQALKKEKILDYSVVSVSVKIIDTKGLSYAIRYALEKSLKNVTSSRPADQHQVLLDGGLKAPKDFIFQKTIIKGDDKIQVISTASVIAKVTRDAYMSRLARCHTEYGFDIHKGYGTRAHYIALKKYDLTPHHRRSFLSRFLANFTSQTK